MKVLLTGGTGFVGAAVIEYLVNLPGFSIRASARRVNYSFPAAVDVVQIGDLASDIDWGAALQSVDVVVHAAARAHVLKDDAPDPLDAFRSANVAGTLSLARQAITAGVERFVFISSIGVNGNQSSSPFTEDSIANPVEPYAVSKMESEHALRELASDSGLEVVIIRPPLIYGPKAPGNFGRLIRAVDRGIPLPFGSIHNKRSLVALDNLVDLVITCIHHPAAANQTFLVADGEDLSTTQLLQRIGKAMGKPARLISVPVYLLELGATLLGKKAMIQRLCGSLQVDITKTREMLGWEPPITVDEGLRRAAAGFNKP